MDDPALRNREGLNAFLRAFDPYAAYIPHAELEELRDMRERYGYGVGMDIVYDQEGRAICIPYAAGPAARNGIAYGDVLLKVDGYDVSGADIDDLAVLVRGEAGTVVELAVLHPQDKSQNEVRTISVQRERVSPPLVQVETNTPEEARIRLYGFSPPVPARLREALASVLAAKPKRAATRAATWKPPCVARPCFCLRARPLHTAEQETQQGCATPSAQAWLRTRRAASSSVRTA